LNCFFKASYLEAAFKSNSYTGYCLTDLARAVAAHREPELVETPHNQKLGLPDDIFEDISPTTTRQRTCLLAMQQFNLLWINRARRE